ncbi:MAG: NADH-quinone oxidoreductase subunit NuoE [Candidatus Omnitrophica bacterium]|nr:NADH-quinone oxidoreductase subunit NuoE [Candidatus Omnitrophota bacterium]
MERSMEQTLDNKQAELKTFIDGFRDKEHFESYLIAVLHKAQEIHGYLKKDVMDDIAREMNIPTSHIWGVATFYHYFNLKPIGKYKISICLGTACYVKGAERILNAVKKELGIEMGDTTPDELFTLQITRCLGACGLAPVAMINDKIHGELTAEKMVDILRKYRKAAMAEAAEKAKEQQ